MITTGAKFSFGLGFLLLVAAVLYGWTSGGADWGLFPGHMGDLYHQLLGALTFGYKGAVGDHVGYTILLGGAAASTTVGAFLTAFRDAESSSLAEVVEQPEAPALQPVATNNIWATVAAFAVAVTAIGVATGGIFVIAGLVLLAVAALEWTVAAWADRTTGDPAVNAAVRNQMMNPIEVPLFGVVVAGFVALGISRVFLALPRVSASWVFIGIAALIFVAAIGLSALPRVTRSLLLGVLAVGGVAVLAAGIAGLSVGEREFHDETEEFTVSGTGTRADGGHVAGGVVYRSTTTTEAGEGGEGNGNGHSE